MTQPTHQSSTFTLTDEADELMLTIDSILATPDEHETDDDDTLCFTSLLDA